MRALSRFEIRWWMPLLACLIGGLFSAAGVVFYGLVAGLVVGITGGVLALLAFADKGRDDLR